MGQKAYVVIGYCLVSHTEWNECAFTDETEAHSHANWLNGLRSSEMNGDSYRVVPIPLHD